MKKEELRSMNHWLSPYGQNLYGSMIDEFLDKKSIAREDSVNFSIGTPGIENIPVEALTEFTYKLMKDRKKELFGYGSSYGSINLREFLKERFNKRSFDLSLENIVITHGSTQGYDLISRLFIEAGDIVITENNTYCTGFSVPSHLGAKVVTVPIEHNGINTDVLEDTLINIQKNQKKLKLLYIIPNAQNPSGVTLSLKKRIRLLELAKKYHFLIVEDDPYRELMFEEQHIPSIFSLDKEKTNVIYLGSFSKIIAPGYRVGFLFSHHLYAKKVSQSKQSTDSSTNPFGQLVIADFCNSPEFETHIKHLISTYQQKKEIMIASLKTHLSNYPTISWTNPEGGMFIYLQTEHISSNNLLQIALSEGVIFVPGYAFAADGKGEDKFRLCFATPKVNEIDIGIQRIKYSIEIYHSKNI
jgi:2-aminoadipate transaminase